MLITVTGFAAAGKSSVISAAAAITGWPVWSADACVAAYYLAQGIDKAERRRFFVADPAHPALMAHELAPVVKADLELMRQRYPQGLLAEWPRTAVPPPGNALLYVQAERDIREARLKLRSGADEALLQAMLAAEKYAAPLPQVPCFVLQNNWAPLVTRFGFKSACAGASSKCSSTSSTLRFLGFRRIALFCRNGLIEVPNDNYNGLKQAVAEGIKELCAKLS